MVIIVIKKYKLNDIIIKNIYISETSTTENDSNFNWFTKRKDKNKNTILNNGITIQVCPMILNNACACVKFL